ncbi:MAG: GNAT family protein [Pseudomonadota bacterium]
MNPLPESFTTGRLVLRRPIPADASTIFQSYTQDPQVCRFMIWQAHSSELVTQAFITSCIREWEAGSSRAYVITGLHSNAAIGMLEARVLGTTVDIAVAFEPLGPQMPEAIRSIADIALKSPGIFRIQASCDTGNIPSQRALEKSGFNREARLERYTVHPNISSEPRACFMYARCR